MQQQIYPQTWIHLPKDVRAVLKKVFTIPHTGVTEVRDQEVVSDGYTVDDLQAITLEKMNEYIGSVETFSRAWEVTLAKVHAELNPPVATIQQLDGEPTIIDIVETITVTEPTGEVIETKVEEVIIVPEEKKEVPKILFTPEEIPKVPVKTPFCDKCASKGVRHFNGCPNKTF